MYILHSALDRVLVFYRTYLHHISTALLGFTREAVCPSATASVAFSVLRYEATNSCGSSTTGVCRTVSMFPFYPNGIVAREWDIITTICTVWSQPCGGSILKGRCCSIWPRSKGQQDGKGSSYHCLHLSIANGLCPQLQNPHIHTQFEWLSILQITQVDIMNHWLPRPAAFDIKTTKYPFSKHTQNTKPIRWHCAKAVLRLSASSANEAGQILARGSSVPRSDAHMTRGRGPRKRDGNIITTCKSSHRIDRSTDAYGTLMMG